MVSANTALKPDHVGIVVLHIYRANDLPKWPNGESFLTPNAKLPLIGPQVTRTGWDMDPFVKVSIGEQVKKTDVERHKLDPVWDKELLFHVRQQDLMLPIRLEIFDWDMFTRNDLVGSAQINVATLVQRAANRDPNTGLHPADLPSVLYYNALPLTKNPDPSRAYTHTPTITFHASYQSYTTLRKQAEQRL
ncbi:C2 domain-containing protein [Lactarius deliciosus]|nr:C2 domain-containing protein [Lactarius deliciosus]